MQAPSTEMVNAPSEDQISDAQLTAAFAELRPPALRLARKAPVPVQPTVEELRMRRKRALMSQVAEATKDSSMYHTDMQNIEQALKSRQPTKILLGFTALRGHIRQKASQEPTAFNLKNIAHRSETQETFVEGKAALIRGALIQKPQPDADYYSQGFDTFLDLAQLVMNRPTVFSEATRNQVVGELNDMLVDLREGINEQRSFWLHEIFWENLVRRVQ